MSQKKNHLQATRAEDFQPKRHFLSQSNTKHLRLLKSQELNTWGKLCRRKGKTSIDLNNTWNQTAVFSLWQY